MILKTPADVARYLGWDLEYLEEVCREDHMILLTLDGQVFTTDDLVELWLFNNLDPRGKRDYSPITRILFADRLDA